MEIETEKLKILEKLGLTENQAKVYLALLRLGSVTAGIIIKETGLHRAYVYEILEKLMDKGLVSHVIQAQRKYFEASSPRKFLEIISEEKQNIQEKEQEIKKILPQLIETRKLETEQEATVYKGKKGLQSIFNDILNEKKDIFVIGATGHFREILKYYYPGWIKRLIQLKIKTSIIYSESRRGKVRKDKFTEAKFIPEEYSSPSTIYIYGEKVAIISWSEQGLIGVVLKSKGMSDSYKKYFELLWKIAKN